MTAVPIYVPGEYSLQDPFNQKTYSSQARSFQGGDSSLVPEQKVVGSQAAEYGVCIWNHEKKGVEQVKMLI